MLRRLPTAPVRLAFDAARHELPGHALCVTTAKKPSKAMVDEAIAVSIRLGAPYQPRGEGSIQRALHATNADFGYVVARERCGTAARHELCRRSDGQRLFVNPRMWQPVTASGFGNAPLARALCPPGRRPPIHIVDATAGLGGTALRMAHTFGCLVTAVEVSAPLACLLDFGMKSLAKQPKPWAEAARSISVVHADADSYLAHLATAQHADGRSSASPAQPCAVFLNPCMDIRRKGSEDVFLQQLARLTPISSSCLQSALAAATRRVVVRLPAGSDPHALLGAQPTDCVAGKQSNYWIFCTRSAA